MTKSLKGRIGRTLAIASLVVGVSVSTSSVYAAECPADKRGVDVRAPDKTPASGVTDTVISSIDVAKEPAHIKGRLFRLRKLVIQPGGVVPWHSHGDRPAIIYIISGTVEEYASTAPCRSCTRQATSPARRMALRIGGKIPVPSRWCCCQPTCSRSRVIHT